MIQLIFDDIFIEHLPDVFMASSLKRDQGIHFCFFFFLNKIPMCADRYKQIYLIKLNHRKRIQLAILKF